MCITGGLSWPRRSSRVFRWPSFTTSSSIASSRGSRWERSRDSPMAKRKRMDRRQFVRTTGAAAAAVLGPTSWVKRQQKTLKIIQWSHFVPAYDAWFDKYAKDWGTAKGVEVDEERGEVVLGRPGVDDLHALGERVARLEDPDDVRADGVVARQHVADADDRDAHSSSLQHLHAGDLLPVRVHGVDRAGEARVERVDRAERLERQLGVRDRVSDERGLVRSLLVLRVARAGVPGGRHDGLVVLELHRLAVGLDDAPVRERAAGRLVEADALERARLQRLHRVGEDGGVALADVLDEELPVLLRELRYDRAADRARGVASEGGVEDRRTELHARDLAGGAEHPVAPLLEARVPLHVPDEQLRERPDLHGLPLEPRRLHPAIALGGRRLGLPLAAELRDGLPLPRAALLVALVVRAGDRLGHVLAEVVVVPARDRPDLSEVAVPDHAAGQVELRHLRVRRHVRDGEVVRHAGAVLEPVGIARRDRGHVRQVDLRDEGLHLVEERLHLVQLLHVERGGAVEVDRVRDAADGEVLDVRRLRAQDRDRLVRRRRTSRTSPSAASR